MTKNKDRSPGFFTPMDIPPTNKSHIERVGFPPPEHEHNWQLASIEEGRATYEAITICGQTIDRYVDKKPDVARYICECGKSKKVEVRDE